MIMHYPQSKFLIYLAIFIAGGVVFLGVNHWVMPNLGTLALFNFKSSPFPFDKNIARESTAVWNDKAALYSYVRKFGPKETILHLHSLGYSQGFGDCHQNAHEAGRFSYEIYEDKAFQLCTGECHSGCYHGATEAYFRDKGTANLAENLKLLCSSELNPFFSHQCIHGIGHGLMAWANYEIFEALKSCDLMPERQNSCWTGVFMENIVGGLAKADIEKSDNPDAALHYTKYLNEDPQYPCNDPNLEEKYRSSCYFLQTSRMVQLFGGNFVKIASACSTAPQNYQRTCFESMGRDVGGVFRGRPEAGIHACSNAPYGTMRVGCLVGAAQDAFWDQSGQDNALRFCELLTDRAEKDSCYNTIFSRAPEVINSKTELQKFCGKAENEYRESCLARIQFWLLRLNLNSGVVP